MLFLDLIVKCVVEYHDGNLVLQKTSLVNNVYGTIVIFIVRFFKLYGTECHAGDGDDKLLPENIQFWMKHPRILFYKHIIAVIDIICSAKKIDFIHNIFCVMMFLT